MLRKYIYLIAGLIIGYLLLSKRNKLPDAVKAISEGFAKLWNPLTKGDKIK